VQQLLVVVIDTLFREVRASPTGALYFGALYVTATML
jgi:hypothetical protein